MLHTCHGLDSDRILVRRSQLQQANVFKNFRKVFRDELVDLSAGEPVLFNELAVYHHYLNASGHDIFLRFDDEATMMVRGEWK